MYKLTVLNEQDGTTTTYINYQIMQIEDFLLTVLLIQNYNELIFIFEFKDLIIKSFNGYNKTVDEMLQEFKNCVDYFYDNF